MSKEMKERLEGLYNIDMMAKLLKQFDSIIDDIQKEEDFEEPDILEFITIKMAERIGYLKIGTQVSQVLYKGTLL